MPLLELGIITLALGFLVYRGPATRASPQGNAEPVLVLQLWPDFGMDRMRGVSDPGGSRLAFVVTAAASLVGFLTESWWLIMAATLALFVLLQAIPAWRQRREDGYRADMLLLGAVRDTSRLLTNLAFYAGLGLLLGSFGRGVNLSQ